MRSTTSSDSVCASGAARTGSAVLVGSCLGTGGGPPFVGGSSATGRITEPVSPASIGGSSGFIAARETLGREVARTWAGAATSAEETGGRAPALRTMLLEEIGGSVSALATALLAEIGDRGSALRAGARAGSGSFVVGAAVVLAAGAPGLTGSRDDE